MHKILSTWILQILHFAIAFTRPLVLFVWGSSVSSKHVATTSSILPLFFGLCRSSRFDDRRKTLLLALDKTKRSKGDQYVQWQRNESRILSFEVRGRSRRSSMDHAGTWEKTHSRTASVKPGQQNSSYEIDNIRTRREYHRWMPLDGIRGTLYCQRKTDGKKWRRI